MVARQAEFDALMAHCPDSDGLRKSLTDLWADPPVAAMAAHVPPAAAVVLTSAVPPTHALPNWTAPMKIGMSTCR